MDVPVTVTLRRLGYRVAYRILQAVWFVARPRKRGVKCLVTDDDRVLLVRHTYGRRSWDIPGGSVKRREAPLSAARREMSEELGLDGAEWTEIGAFDGQADHRRDTIYCFRAELAAPPLSIAHAELETVGWFDRGRLPHDLAPYVKPAIAILPAIVHEDGQRE